MTTYQPRDDHGRFANSTKRRMSDRLIAEWQASLPDDQRTPPPEPEPVPAEPTKPTTPVAPTIPYGVRGEPPSLDWLREVVTYNR